MSILRDILAKQITVAYYFIFNTLFVLNLILNVYFGLIINFFLIIYLNHINCFRNMWLNFSYRQYMLHLNTLSHNMRIFFLRLKRLLMKLMLLMIVK